MSQLTAEKALELNDSDPGVYNNMGVTFLIQSNEPAAIEKFKTAVKLDSAHYESNMNLGWTAVNSGDYALAMTSFEAATAANPSSQDGKLGLAIAKRGVKEYKEAGQIYDEIIDNGPADRSCLLQCCRAARVLHEGLRQGREVPAGLHRHPQRRTDPRGLRADAADPGRQGRRGGPQGRRSRGQAPGRRARQAERRAARRGSWVAPRPWGPS